jgi:hypothetical protein
MTLEVLRSQVLGPALEARLTKESTQVAGNGAQTPVDTPMIGLYLQGHHLPREYHLQGMIGYHMVGAVIPETIGDTICRPRRRELHNLVCTSDDITLHQLTESLSSCSFTVDRYIYEYDIYWTYTSYLQRTYLLSSTITFFVSNILISLPG